jgi:hypothetical protein
MFYDPLTRIIANVSHGSVLSGAPTTYLFHVVKVGHRNDTDIFLALAISTGQRRLGHDVLMVRLERNRTLPERGPGFLLHRQPLFTCAAIDLGGKRTFTIAAPAANKLFDGGGVRQPVFSINFVYIPYRFS